MNCWEDAVHVLFKCKKYNDERQSLLQSLELVAPDIFNLYAEFVAMSDANKLFFIASCMNGSFVNEWLPVYLLFIEYVANPHAKARDIGS